jgi:hypothetical protein
MASAHAFVCLIAPILWRGRARAETGRNLYETILDSQAGSGALRTLTHLAGWSLARRRLAGGDDLLADVKYEFTVSLEIPWLKPLDAHPPRLLRRVVVHPGIVQQC